MRRCPVFTEQFSKKVLLKLLWYVVFFNHDFGFWMVFNVTLKTVKRAIISAKKHILEVFAQGDFEFSS